MARSDDDAQWIHKSQRGDTEAFSELVKRHQRMIHSLTLRMTGSMAEGEDLAQETFVRAYGQLGRFRGDAKFSSWLYRIAVNACLNFQKGNQRRLRVHAEWGRQQQIEAEGRSPCHDDSVSQRVQEALLRLHPKQRAAVVLTIYNGVSHAEAAKVLGCSETTVSWRLFAARAKLKRWLKDLRTDD